VINICLMLAVLQLGNFANKIICPPSFVYSAYDITSKVNNFTVTVHYYCSTMM